MMGLLTTMFQDATSRLGEALEDIERQRVMDESPTPKSTPPRMGAEGVFNEEEEGTAARRTVEERVSFAPMLSHISRFAVHVEAISSTLDDAKDHLEECVAALREEPTPSPRRRRDRRSTSSIQRASDEHDTEESKALQAYERLRRELGMALRECERGRERLLDIVRPTVMNDSDEGDSDDLPAFGHDASDDSDRGDPSSPIEEAHPSRAIGLTVVGPDGTEDPVDDATAHLLFTASTQHLPPVGVEQVYEAETGTGIVFNRERSKLTREERIKLAKVRRESGGTPLSLDLGTPLSSASSGSGSGIERWGPGGEVVQELKDVIWKVGERRRKMTSDVAASS